MDLAPLPLPSQEYSCVCPPTYRVLNVQFTCFFEMYNSKDFYKSTDFLVSERSYRLAKDLHPPGPLVSAQATTLFH